MTHKTLRKDRAEITLRAVFYFGMGGAATGCRGRAALPWGLPALPVLLRAGAAPGLLGGGIPPASLTAPRPGGGGIRTDQAPLPITDQILTARAVESLQHQLPV